MGGPEQPAASGPDRWDEDGRPGSAPLERDETLGLIPSWVATRADLNAAEQANILKGLSKHRWRRPTVHYLLDDLAVRSLHKDLLGEVWRWAGTYRNTERNIGVDPHYIGVAVRDLVDDARAWLEGPHPMPADEAGCRFHHRLVQIHPFPNGNGRHARAMTDLLLRALGTLPFSWGQTNLGTASQRRSAYIAALRAADDGDLGPLTLFARN